jgi:alpha-1,2-rhamnosyltransferase
VTIWYDFTTTIRNTSRNGIANVEWSLGSALLDSEGDVRCCSLDQRFGLIEIDPAIDLAGAVYAAPDVLPAVVPKARSMPRTLAAEVAGLLGSSRAPIERAARWSYRLARRARRAALRQYSKLPRPGAGRQVRLVDVVGADDVVISMGADWSGELPRHLKALKQTTGCRVVLMVYDLIPLTHTHLAFHKDRQLFADYYRAVITTGDLITCISEQSRRDLQEFAMSQHLTLGASRVLRLGDGVAAPASVGRRREDFYLWVGTIERRKNIELLFDALRILESEQRTLPKIVVAGSIGWGVSDVLAEIELQSTLASRSIVLLGPVDDATLAGLYERAKALLFPSHYEGWGLPVREAAIRGCPVAAGDSPAVREALEGYDGAVLLPVDDPGPWADYLCVDPPKVAPALSRTWKQATADLVSLAAPERAVGV